jgi:Rrf2 family protein
MKKNKKANERSSLMHIGRRVDYAVRALAYLAAQPSDRIVTRTEIEKRQDIPFHYLSKIMKDLVDHGLVHSQVGAKGGFRLAKSAKDISIKEVYESMEGPLVLMQCLGKDENYCLYPSVCTQISVWERVQALVANFLATIPMSEIADQAGLRNRPINLAI